MLVDVSHGSADHRARARSTLSSRPQLVALFRAGDLERVHGSGVGDSRPPPQPDRRGWPLRVLEHAYCALLVNKAQDLGTTE